MSYMSAIFNFDFSVYTTCQFNSIQFILFSIIKKIKTIKPQGKKMNKWRRHNEKQKPVKVAPPLEN